MGDSKGDDRTDPWAIKDDNTHTYIKSDIDPTANAREGAG